MSLKSGSSQRSVGTSGNQDCNVDAKQCEHRKQRELGRGKVCVVDV